jgi:hypothetical protein
MKWEDNQEKFDYTEKYNVDFISKNYQGTIQNDNLPNGNFRETWFKKPLSKENHLMANGYANSWIIDTNKVCEAQSEKLPSDNSFCTKNSDGSYDFEIVVEFWPQRLYYLGLIISGTTLVLCLGYFGWVFVKRRKEKGVTASEEN